MVGRRRDRRTDLKLSKATNAFVIRCAAGRGWINEEIWTNQDGIIVKYNLAFINHSLFARDNGRVLGYDAAHGFAHRHFCGQVEEISLGAQQIVSTFYDEVERLRKVKSL